MKPLEPPPPRIVSMLTNLSFQIASGIVSAILIVVFIISAYVYNPLVGANLDVTEYPVRIAAVLEDTPAQAAGLLVGDQVLEIDGRAIPPWGNAPIYRAGIRPGEIIIFEILRGDQPLTIPVPAGQLLTQPVEIVLNIALILLPIGFWLMGLLMVLFAAEKALPARLFGFHWMITGLSLAAAIFGRAGYFWGANTTFLVCWSLLIFTNIAVHMHFPVPMMSGKWQSRIINVLAIIAIGLAVLSVLSDWVFFPRAWAAGVQAYQAFLPLGFTLAWLIPLGYFSSFLVGIGLLVANHVRFRRLQPGLSQQTRLVIAGMVLAILPLFLLTFIPYLITDAPLLNQNLGFLFFLLIPLAYAYAIFQKKLIRIDLMINRSVVWFLLVLTILGASSLLLLFFTRMFSIPEAAFPLLGGGVTVLIALPTAGLHDRFQVLVNRLMYGEHYDYTSLTSEFSTQFAKTVEREKLIRLLVSTLPQRMGVLESALLLAEDGCLKQQGGRDPVSLSFDSPFCQILQQRRVPLPAGELNKVLPENLAWGQLYAPLISENRLYGLLIWGARAKGDVYHTQDVQIVTTVTQQAALAYANLRHLERQRGMKRQMVRANEASRKEVAAELHDFALQNLVYVWDFLQRLPELNEVTGYLGEAIQQIRRTIKAQRPSILNRSLDLAVQELILDSQRMAGNVPKFSWYTNLKEPLEMAEEKKTAIYRIVQEALANARKHAHAQAVRVKLEKTAQEEYVILVEDDGIGMPEEARRKEEHYGLEWMYERAMMIEAGLHISSHPGAGTTVILRFTV